MTRVKIHGNNANERDAFFQSQDLVLGDVSTATCAKRTRSHDKIDQDFLSKRLKSTVNSQRENPPVSSRQHPATKNEKGCGPKPLQSSQHDTTMKENLFKGLRFCMYIYNIFGEIFVFDCFNCFEISTVSTFVMFYLLSH